MVANALLGKSLEFAKDNLTLCRQLLSALASESDIIALSLDWKTPRSRREREETWISL